MKKTNSKQSTPIERNPDPDNTDSDVLLRLIILLVVMLFGFLFIESSMPTSPNNISLSDSTHAPD